MIVEWKYDYEEIDWNELSALYKLASMGKKNPNDLMTVFSNSRYTCFVFVDSLLIGAGRALADGVDCSYICDVAVYPQYQGLGLGKKIVQNLVQLSQGHNKIILYANPGKEGFYSKLGFMKMNTAMAIFRNQSSALEAGLLERN